MSEFMFVFPAIKGIQATRDYYVAMCPLGMLSKMFQLPDEDLLPEFRAQRILNKNRIPSITRYIAQNPEDYVFSSLAASVDGEMIFAPSHFSPSVGTLSIAMNSRILINDGQHRRAAIEEAIKDNPGLSSETISVVFFYDLGLKRCQQMFADLNKHAINTSRSLGIFYDGRDPLSTVVREIVEEIPLLRDNTSKDADNLSALAPQIFTLTNIYNSVERILGKKRDKKITDDGIHFVRAFWSLLSETIIEWKDVQSKQLKATELRKNYIHAHGVVLDALGLLGNYIYQNERNNLKNYICRLNKINWKRSNTVDWVGRAISPQGGILKTKHSPILTYIHIKRLLNLPLLDQDYSTEKKHLAHYEKAGEV
ncbi:DNA sulfur modification protein DndB [Heliobacterium gestii]|uniref:DNA sulfur modification protein DndB n=1 Tax=Heliomicrobium gestii TaxID=2699 RepID=A0A845LGD9_HELGE|nr:DNA sulfur modification protein DndB [Heliomicrobium gestii]MBM7865677.1 DNA sulfur modification protein DndB [Heliomicrobium gestii]MZP41926.1 DNA sulfur modification protein DndB [Heliomicrobium gestii]